MNHPTRRQFHQSALAGLTGGWLATRPGWASTPLLQRTGAANDRVAIGQKGSVASVHPLASQAAIEAFQQGGNAMDAAAAASVMLSVVDGFNSGIGGGCLALIRTADGSIHAIDGRETAPAAASPEMFYRNGQPDPQLSQIGPRACGIPGLLAALSDMVSQHGRLDLSGSFARASHVAEAGFAIDANYASRLSSAASRLKRFPESARILLDASGEPWPEGHHLQQPDLARTFQKLADQGVDWFYKGEFAERTADHIREQGGLLSAQDFANYRAHRRDPVSVDYRDHRVYGFPPPSSGGIHVGQILTMLSAFDVRGIFRESPAKGMHLLLECMKLAMADRAYWLGDSDFASVPKGLLDPTYLADRAARIDLERVTKVESHGQPPRFDVDLFGRGGHTTHVTTADEAGNVVALTQTVNTTFGCKMIVPGTGVVLNNELDDFSIAPGVRNAFGLLGSSANLIAPGKRPLSSMSPTIVVDADGHPRLTCGAAGGPKIITTVLQMLVRCLDLDQPIDQALAAGRCHHQWSPDRAVCETRVAEQTRNELQQLGHEIQTISSAAVCQGIAFASGKMTAASDPRVPSAARSL